MNVCFELEGTYVNLLIYSFEDSWLLILGDIVIQMKFDGTNWTGSLQMIKCSNENVKHQGYFQSM